jgi:acetylornithine aminotransferase
MATISATAQPKYHGPEACWKVPDLFENFDFNDAASAEQAFRDHDVAAVLVEPVQGEGGVRVGDAAFFAKLRELCDASGALLMFDEVQAGVGRTGKLWAHEHLGVAPDVVTTAKALGGGVPLGAMLCAERANVFAPGDHATTYGGNPLACAAGLAVAAAVDDDGLVDNARDRGAQLEAGLKRLAADHAGKISEVRGLGLLLGIELDPALGGAAKFVQAAADRGLLLVPAGVDVVRFVPPLVVTAAQIDKALAILGECLASA